MNKNLNEIEWKLESETRNIGDYTCFKATTTREVEDVESGISFDGHEEINYIRNRYNTSTPNIL